MTARIVVSCDGTWDDGRMPCRGAYPTGTDHRGTALGKAYRAGWDYVPEVGDLCPAHARQHAARQVVTVSDELADDLDHATRIRQAALTDLAGRLTRQYDRVVHP